MTLGRILTSKQMRERVGGISRWTEIRMHQRGEGPPRLRIASWGYPETLLEEWLLSRLEKPLKPAPAAGIATFNPKADDEGTAKDAAKIGEEAEQLRSGDPKLLSHIIPQELERSEGKPDRLLLYIDQWEELYAQAPSPSVDRDRGARHTSDSTVLSTYC
jgi:hypothetical protein